eukprot:5737037-Pyramimonas_sp.AAC.1
MWDGSCEPAATPLPLGEILGRFLSGSASASASRGGPIESKTSKAAAKAATCESLGRLGRIGVSVKAACESLGRIGAGPPWAANDGATAGCKSTPQPFGPK